MGVPGPSCHVERECVLDLLGLGPRDPETGQNVEGYVDDGVSDLHVEVQLEEVLLAELHESLKGLPFPLSGRAAWSTQRRVADLR